MRSSNFRLVDGPARGGDRADDKNKVQQSNQVADSNLSWIAGRTARDHSVKVFIGEKDGGSFANLEEKEITLDPLHVKNEAAFIAAHEGAHIGETVTLQDIGKTPQEIRGYSGMIGFHSLRNVTEDCAINDRFSKEYPPLQKETLAAYPRMSSSVKGEEVILNLPEVQEIARRLRRVPLFSQALSGILNDWSELRHQFGFEKSLSDFTSVPRQGATYTDPDVIKFFKDNLGDVRHTASLIPEPGTTARESYQKGVERLTWCEEILYPALKKLVDMDIKDLAKKLQQESNSAQQGQNGQEGSRGNEGGSSKQASSKDSKNNPENKDGQGGSEGNSDPQSGDSPQQGEGGQESKEGKEGASNKQNSSKDSKNNPENKDGQGGSEGNSDPQSGDSPQQGEGGQESKEGKEGASNKQNSSNGAKESGQSTDTSDGAKDSSNQGSPHGGGAGQQISESEARRQAREMIAAVDDAIRKHLESLKDKAQGTGPSALEVVREENDAERREEAAQEAQRQAEEIARQLRQSLNQSLTPYHQEYQTIAAHLEEAYNRLIDVFEPERHFKWQSREPSGTRVDMHEAMRFELTGKGYDSLWQRRIDPKYPDTEIVILLDRSGSMNHDHKWLFARRALVLAKELFGRLHIRCAVVGFGDSPGQILDFDDDISEPEIQKTLMESSGPLEEGTNDARAIAFAADLLAESSAHQRAIIILSDAGTSEAAGELRKTVRTLNDQGLPVLHFGLGPETQDTEKNYIHSWGGLSLSDSSRDGFLAIFCREMERLAQDALK